MYITEIPIVNTKNGTFRCFSLKKITIVSNIKADNIRNMNFNTKFSVFGIVNTSNIISSYTRKNTKIMVKC